MRGFLKMLLGAVAALALVVGYFVWTEGVEWLLPPVDGLRPLADHPTIHAEPGAEALAGQLAAALPTAAAAIEAAYGPPLGGLPTVVVCITDACYGRFAFTKGSTAETQYNIRMVFNGELIQADGRVPGAILTHELSHLFWTRQGAHNLPRWFDEGQAVWVSGGGGAERAPVEDARRALKDGHRIAPSLTPMPETADDLPGGWPMFYRQAGMFVGFLHDRDPAAFAALIAELRRTRDLAAAWKAYPVPLEQAWQEFLASEGA